MDWLSLTPALLLGAALLILPGLLIVCAVRVRGLDAVAAAPGVSVAVVAISAILAARLGIGWSLWVPFVFATVLALVLGAVQALVRRVQHRRRRAGTGVPQDARSSADHRTEGTAEGKAAEETTGTAGSRRAGRAPWGITDGTGVLPSRWWDREQLAYWISLLVSGALMLRILTRSIGAPDRFSQTFDNNFHLNAVRWIAETGNASSLDLTTMTSGGGAHDFYPAAWHDLVSLVFLGGGGTIPEATNAVTLVVGALVWPLSILFLLRSMMRLNLPAILCAGPLLAGFVAFPMLLINFGVLYPNFLGLALLPAGLALVLELFRVGRARRLETSQAVLLGLPVALGIALAHPNAIMSLLVMMVPVLLTRAGVQILRAARGHVRWWAAALQVLGIVVILWVIWYLWGVVRPEASAATWEPSTSEAQAFGEALINSPLSLVRPQWFVSALVVLGIATAFLLRTNRWLVMTYAVVVYYYVAVRYLSWEQDRMWATGVWYNDPYRLAALLPLAAVPLAVLGIHGSTVWLGGLRLPQRLRDRMEGAGRPRVLAGLGAVLLIVCIGMTQFTAPMKQMMNENFWIFYPRQDAPLVDADELDVIEHVDQYVPEDATLVVNPWTGGALAYALADRRTTAEHTLYTPTAEEKVLDDSLDEARKDPRVCQAVESTGARYVLDFSGPEINGGDHSADYPGLQDLEDSGATRTLYARGGARLLEITACG